MKKNADKARVTAKCLPVEGNTKAGRQRPCEGTQAEISLFTVEIPADDVNPANLMNLIAAKGHLIKKALGTRDLTIEADANTYRFPWFRNIPAEEAPYYREFIEALCRHSVARKRITAREKVEVNERYAMRCFLCGIGLIGPEYKMTRKILCRNLAGSASYKARKRKGEQR